MKKNNPVIMPTPGDFIPTFNMENKVPVVDYITSWAEKEPARLALVANDNQYTYGELNEHINQVANGLLQLLGEGNKPIGVLFGKDAFAIISILGTLKSGNFYAGFDPTSPISFLQTICDDLEPAVVLTSSLYMHIAEEIAGSNTQVINVEQWFSEMPLDEPDVTVPLSAIAGIYYTSGSTGKSKGVMLDQRALWHRIYSNVTSQKYSQSDRTCLPFSVSFGWSTKPLLCTLVTGGRLFLYDFAEKPVIEVADWFLENKITIAPMPSAFMRQFLSGLPNDFDSNFPDMRCVFAGGDVIVFNDLLMWQKHFSATCILAYSLASSEVGTITRSYYKTDTIIKEDNLTFGIPSPGVEVMIVDEGGKPVLTGTPGEIAIRSKGIMVGYWKNESLTQKKLIADPENAGEQLLLTGDMGKMNDNNSLEFAGRKDSQVKIRGYLVNITHITSVIRGLKAVEDVVTTSYRRKNGELRLAAYVVFKQDDKLSILEFKRLLGVNLPSYMIPQNISVLDTLPRSTSGKVNTYLLPTPTNERPVLETAYAPPQSELETQIAMIWQDILEMDAVGVYDNFFDLGGDSLSALEMTLEVESVLSKSVPQIFFANPTVLNLAQLFMGSNQEEQEQAEFILESYKNVPRNDGLKIPDRSRIKNLLTRKYSLVDFDRLIDKVVSKYFVKLPYLAALQWSMEWSQKKWTRDFLYQRRSSLFSQWLECIGVDHAKFPNAFQMNLLTNMQFRLPKPIEKMRKSQNKLENYQLSPFLYWRTMGELIESIPMGEMNPYFPILKSENLMQAYQKGKGVVLVSFHGAPRTGSFTPLKRLLQEDNILTISYKIPLEQSQYRNQKEKRSEVAGATLNAEIALYGQRHLLSGGIVNFASDTNDIIGRTYKVSIGGRAYQIKGGFAELALNTEAVIIPFSRYCLPDGKTQTEFGEPLLPGSGDRHEKIERLIQKYANFIEASWKAHPDAISWTKLKRHLELPIADE